MRYSRLAVSVLSLSLSLLLSAGWLMVPMLMAPPHAVKYGELEPEKVEERKRERKRKRVKIKGKNKLRGSMLILQPRHRRCGV